MRKCVNSLVPSLWLDSAPTLYGNVARNLDEIFEGTYETGLLNSDLIKFAELLGTIGMRADDLMDLKSQLPGVIYVPLRHFQLPPTKQHVRPASIPWTEP